MSIKSAIAGIEYTIHKIDTGDSALNAFLLTLGCYSGEKVKLIRKLKSGCIISLKGVKYHVDNHLANAILV